LLLFPYTPPHPYLHSFPTRRSSDLAPPTSFVSCPAIRAFPHFRYPQAHFRPRRLLPQLLPVIFPINLVCKRPQRIGPRQLLRGATLAWQFWNARSPGVLFFQARLAHPIQVGRKRNRLFAGTVRLT